MKRLFTFAAIFLLAIVVPLSGCRQSGDLYSTTPASDFSSPAAALDPDAFLEVDCLLPGQIRKLGSMIYPTPRRPVKTTANDCTIRGGEYVLYDRANYREALAVWMVEAESGDPLAQTYVGEIYLKSPPENPRYDLAAAWFERAAEKGHKRAQVNLGYLYENGLGVPPDKKAAATWYSKASGSDLEEIIQQQQLTIQERAELDELKRTNEAQLEEIERLALEKESVHRSLANAQKELTEKNRSIEIHLQKIAGQRTEMQQIERDLARKSSDTSPHLKQQLLEMQAGLDSKEKELRQQKRLAASLSEEVKRHKELADNYELNLASLNHKISELPGPKIEVMDPQLLRTRGIVVAPIEQDRKTRMMTGMVWAPAGLQYLKVNDLEVSVNDQGRFTADIQMEGEQQSVHVVAFDQNGKSDEVQFNLQRVETVRGSGGTVADSKNYSKITFGKYYALVIGNNNYLQLPSLKTAREDARVVASLLENRYGFEVTVLYDANRVEILSALNDYRKKLTENDNFLLYYAGHGTLEEKNTQGFWLPVDSSLDSDVNWIATDRITGIMNLMSAKQIMVVADACYSGIMTRASLTRLDSGKSQEAYGKWLKKMAAYKSRIIISSGETKPVLDGGGGKHSVFAKALLDTLQTNTKILLGIDLHRAIAEKVVDASGRIGHAQVPQYAGLNRAGHEFGDFLFVPKQG